jgi:hypothetical protein
VDTTAPVVTASDRGYTSPTSKKVVNFKVLFSETVTGVDKTDFVLVKTGAITGASITQVIDDGLGKYTVIINTGTLNGTLRLNVANNGSIKDLAGNALAVPFTTGQTYTVQKVQTFTSQPGYDGWLLESTATSNMGGSFNVLAPTFNLGDDAARKQYRGLLSFSTAGLPDTAVITKVTLKVKKSTITGAATFVMFGGLKLDVKKGPFGALALAKTDFEALTGATGKSYGPYTALVPVANVYTVNLPVSGATSVAPYINKMTTLNGVTQFRLRFTKGDNANTVANFISFYTGNSTTAANRPTLTIEYYVP